MASKNNQNVKQYKDDIMPHNSSKNDASAVSETDKRKIHIYVVRVQNAAANATVNALLDQAFKELGDADMAPEWATVEFCQSLKHELKRTLFVLPVFDGACFQHLADLRCKIIGPSYVLSCLRADKPVKKSAHPILSGCMDKAIVSCSNLTKAARDDIHEQIYSMGGCVEGNLTENCNFLITTEVGSKKYKAAVKHKSINIVTPQWVNEAWYRSHVDIFDATSQEFWLKFKCPVFAGLSISVSFIQHDERDEIEKLIIKNGGKYLREMKQGETTHLITASTESQKYKFAKRWESWPIFTVTKAWLYDSIEQGFCLEENEYLIENSLDPEKQSAGRKPKASTPTKARVSLADPDYSAIPAASWDVPNVTVCSNISGISDTSRVNETALSTTSHVFAVPMQKGPKRPVIPIEPTITEGGSLDGSNATITEEPKGDAAANTSQRCSISSNADESPTSIENLDLAITTSGDFVQNCKIFLHGFTDDHAAKFRKIINAGGGQRVSRPDMATHIVLGEPEAIDRNFMSKLKEQNGFILTSQWLIECFKRGTRLPEAEYGHSIAKIPEQSAVSQRPQTDNSDNDFDILAQYITDPVVNAPNHAANDDVPLRQEPVEENQAAEVQSDDTPVDSMETGKENLDGVFGGKTFVVSGYSDEAEAQKICEYIEMNSGTTSVHGVVDYLVMPDLYDEEDVEEEPEIQSRFVVNKHWLDVCVEKNVTVPANESQFYGCYKISKRVKPLAGCVICISQYIGYERQFISSLADALGACVQDNFAKSAKPADNLKASTHLVLEKAEGSKYEAAVRWKLPAVSASWLADCARHMKKMDTSAYMMKETSTKTVEEPSLTQGARSAARASSKSQRQKLVGGNGTASKSTIETTMTQTPKVVHKQLERLVLTLDNKTAAVPQLTEKPATEPIRQQDICTENNADPSVRMFDPDKPFRPMFDLTEAYACLEKEEQQEQARKIVHVDSPTDSFIEKVLATAVAKTAAAKSFYDTPQFSRPKRARVESDTDERAFFGSQTPLVTPAPSGPLVGTVITVCKRMSGEYMEFSNMAKRLGATYRVTLDASCTHLIFKGRTTDGDYKTAREMNMFVVDPSWLRECLKTKMRVDENLYPPTLECENQFMQNRNEITQHPAMNGDGDTGNAQIVQNVPCASNRIEPPDFTALSEDNSPSEDLRIHLAKHLQGVMDRLSLNKTREETSPSSTSTTALPIRPANFFSNSQQIDYSQESGNNFVVDWEDPNQKLERQRVGDLLRKRHEPTQNAFIHIQGIEESLPESLTMPVREIEKVFQLTALDNNERAHYVNLITKFGGKMSKSSNFDMECTHLIAKHPTRNEKILSAIARGIWVLHLSYLDASEQANSFVEESDYEFGTEKTASIMVGVKEEMLRLMRSCPLWRQKFLETGRTAYSEWKVFVFAEVEKENDIIRILQNGGAFATKLLQEAQKVDITHVIFEPGRRQKPVKLQTAINKFKEAGAKCCKMDVIFTYLINGNIDDALIS